MPSRPTHSPWIRLLAGWAAAVAVCAAAAWPTHGQTVNYSGSLQYATGSYLFAERTHSVYLFNGLDLSHGRLQAAVSLPVIYQSSPWVSYTVVGSVPSGGPQQGAVGGRGSGSGSGDGGGPGSGRRRGGDPIVLPDTATYADIGVGDPSLRADLTLLRGTTGPTMRLAGSAKAPVADVDRGFGTGAWDAGLGLSLAQRLGRWFLFGEALHWWLGDMDDLTLQNTVSYSASLGRVFQNGRLGVLASFSGYTEIIDAAAPPLQTVLGLNYQFGGGAYSLSATASAGLSESVPDVSVSLGWRVTL